jgi:hypothetical protein
MQAQSFGLHLKTLMDKKQNRQSHAENEEKIGHKSFMGATSTDPEKQRLQTTEANELDTEDPMGANHTDKYRGVKNTNQSTAEMDNRTGIPDNDEDEIDQGSIRTAAFDEGNDPRSEESLKNRGVTQGSNDQPGTAGEQTSETIGKP